MKRAIACIFLPALIILASCGGGGPKVLHFYTWSDYIDEKSVERFEQENNCDVVMDYFDSNEAMYAKLKAGGGGYDLILPTSYMVNVMSGQGMLEKLNHAMIPNLANIDSDYRRFTADPEMQYSVPYMVGTTGIGYLKSKVPDFEASWRVFGDSRYVKRMTLLNDMRETIGSALKALGYSINTTDDAELEAAKLLVLAWKRNIAKFESDQYKNGLVSGEFVISQGFSGDIMQVMEENSDIEYVLPSEGTSIYVDEFAIPKGAKEVELAHRFINFLHDPEVAAANTTTVYFLCPNRPSYSKLSEEILGNPAIFIPQQLLEKCELIRDLGEDNAKYTRIWDEIKGAE